MSGEDREKEDLESKDSAGHEEPSGAKSEAEAPPAG